MAALLYKDCLIIATGQFDQNRELWIPIADMSWHSATGRESQSHPARRASISEHQNFLDKVKQRNELIQEKTGQTNTLLSFSARPYVRATNQHSRVDGSVQSCKTTHALADCLRIKVQHFTDPQKRTRPFPFRLKPRRGSTTHPKARAKAHSATTRPPVPYAMVTRRRTRQYRSISWRGRTSRK